MPFLTADVTDERDGLAVFAQQQIQQFTTTLQELDLEQLRATPTASEMCLGGIALHLLAVVDDFRLAVEAAPDLAEVPERPGRDEAAVGQASPEAVLDQDTADSLIARLTEAAESLGAALRSADLDAPVPAPEAPWIPEGVRWTVRWVGLHAIEEVARHAGHADILRETIDGKVAYELNAMADGVDPSGEW